MLQCNYHFILADMNVYGCGVSINSIHQFVLHNFIKLTQKPIVHFYWLFAIISKSFFLFRRLFFFMFFNDVSHLGDVQIEQWNEKTKTKWKRKNKAKQNNKSSTKSVEVTKEKMFLERTRNSFNVYSPFIGWCGISLRQYIVSMMENSHLSIFSLHLQHLHLLRNECYQLITNMGWHLFDGSKCFDSVFVVFIVAVVVLFHMKCCKFDAWNLSSIFKSERMSSFLYMVIFLIIFEMSIPIIIWDVLNTYEWWAGQQTL